MNARHLLTYVLGFAVGGVLPVSASLAGGFVHAQTPAHQAVVRHAPLVAVAGPVSHASGTTPATIIAIRENGCKSFTITGAAAAAPAAVTKDDPRYNPCTPTASHFAVQWSSLPTRAQMEAYVRVMTDLAVNHPTIALADADPLIRAAVAAAQ